MAFEPQPARLIEGILEAGSHFRDGRTGPNRLLIELNPFGFHATEDHRAEAAVANRKGVDRPGFRGFVEMKFQRLDFGACGVDQQRKENQASHAE